jgi:DNA-binding Lrp family transcriptional regulator
MIQEPVDLRLLQLLQDEFPLETKPWDALGRRLDMSGEEVRRRVNRLLESGVLRAVCPVLESAKTGIGASTLVALHVAPEKVEEVAQGISAFAQVSHNYLREHQFNIWFTLAAKNREELECILFAIRQRWNLDGENMIELPVKRRFKIDVRFPIDRGGLIDEA